MEQDIFYRRPPASSVSLEGVAGVVMIPTGSNHLFWRVGMCKCRVKPTKRAWSQTIEASLEVGGCVAPTASPTHPTLLQRCRFLVIPKYTIAAKMLREQ
jgi:hypothetical protein